MFDFASTMREADNALENGGEALRRLVRERRGRRGAGTLLAPQGDGWKDKENVEQI